MRNSTLTKLFMLTAALLFTMQSVFSQAVADSAQMDGGYVNDVYYNIETGTKVAVDRKNWDLGFTTEGFNSNIIINDGAGVLVYAYPTGDTSAWSTVDTAGLSTWTPLFNYDKDWYPGGIDHNALGHPDYGWGIYNDINHNVIGDSLFIIKTAAGDWKKLWIQRLVSMAVTFEFKFADLDGSNEQAVELVAKDYQAKNFVYYNISTQAVVDREPAKTDWHLLFTRWVSDDYLPNTIQLVAGVFINKSVEVAELKNFDIAGDTCYLDAAFSAEKDIIGYDWKKFSMATFTYVMEDSLVYFVKTANNMIYELNWDAFDYSVAKFVFHKELLNPAAPTDAVIDDAANTFAWTPNPLYLNATDYEYITPTDTVACTANPQVIAGDYEAGEVFIRVKADAASCRVHGLGLANDVAFTGIFNPVKNQISMVIYPNPAKESLNIKVNDFNNTTANIQVYNLMGALLFEDIISNVNNYTLSTVDFANGVYTIKIQSDNKTGNKMFVVNN